ncbi:hypothetical protein D3C84_1078100 [compost metagenome]
MTIGLYVLNIWSKPAFSILPIASVATTMVIGISEGIVICVTCFHRFAPSISAASYKVGSILASVARKTMAPKPNSFQISLTIIVTRYQSPSSRNGIGSIPNIAFKV